MSKLINRKSATIAGVAVLGVVALAFGGRKLIAYVRKDMEERDCDNLLEYAMERVLGKAGENEDIDQDMDEDGPWEEGAGEGCASAG